MASRDNEIVVFWAMILGGLAFTSFVLFLVPALMYDQIPIMLAFDLWIAVVVTSAGVNAVMGLARQKLEIGW